MASESVEPPTQVGEAGKPPRIAVDDARRVRARVRVGPLEAPVGMLRGALALILIGTLVAAVFAAPPKGSQRLSTALQTLSVSVIAFYFGSRSRKSIKHRSKGPATEPSNQA